MQILDQNLHCLPVLRSCPPLPDGGAWRFSGWTYRHVAMEASALLQTCYSDFPSFRADASALAAITNDLAPAELAQRRRVGVHATSGARSAEHARTQAAHHAPL